MSVASTKKQVTAPKPSKLSFLVFLGIKIFELLPSYVKLRENTAVKGCSEFRKRWFVKHKNSKGEHFDVFITSSGHDSGTQIS